MSQLSLTLQNAATTVYDQIFSKYYLEEIDDEFWRWTINESKELASEFVKLPRPHKKIINVMGQEILNPTSDNIINYTGSKDGFSNISDEEYKEFIEKHDPSNNFLPSTSTAFKAFLLEPNVRTMIQEMKRRKNVSLNAYVESQEKIRKRRSNVSSYLKQGAIVAGAVATGYAAGRLNTPTHTPSISRSYGDNTAESYHIHVPPKLQNTFNTRSDVMVQAGLPVHRVTQLYQRGIQYYDWSREFPLPENSYVIESYKRDQLGVLSAMKYGDGITQITPSSDNIPFLTSSDTLFSEMVQEDIDDSYTKQYAQPSLKRGMERRVYLSHPLLDAIHFNNFYLKQLSNANTFLAQVDEQYRNNLVQAVSHVMSGVSDILDRDAVSEFIRQGGNQFLAHVPGSNIVSNALAKASTYFIVDQLRSLDQFVKSKHWDSNKWISLNHELARSLRDAKIADWLEKHRINVRTIMTNEGIKQTIHNVESDAFKSAESRIVDVKQPLSAEELIYYAQMYIYLNNEDGAFKHMKSLVDKALIWTYYMLPEEDRKLSLFNIKPIIMSVETFFKPVNDRRESYFDVKRFMQFIFNFFKDETYLDAKRMLVLFDNFEFQDDIAFNGSIIQKLNDHVDRLHELAQKIEQASWFATDTRKSFVLEFRNELGLFLDRMISVSRSIGDHVIGNYVNWNPDTLEMIFRNINAIPF